jgi:hypothetical protein
MVFDPVGLVFEVAQDLYPGIKADVFISAATRKRGEYGCTDFGPRRPAVMVSYRTPLFAMPEIVAHELAHVAVGIESEHGPKWERAFAKIHREYNRRVVVQARKSGLTVGAPVGSKK